MSRIIIVGGHGQIALHLTRLLSPTHDVVGLIRNPDHAADIAAAGGTGHVLDLETSTVQEAARVCEGAEAIVFAAGAGAGSTAERKQTVDYGAAVLTADAAGLAGVSRLVQISALRVETPVAEDADPVWRAYIDAKRAADHYVRDTELDWTILRPGLLTNDAPTGLVDLGPSLDAAAITRADVAATVAAILAEPGSIRRTWDAVNGTTPLADSLRALVS